MGQRPSALEDVAVNPDFFRRRRVFVTGHTGFKGSWLSLWLQRLGADVTGYALAPPTNPSLFEEARVAEGMASVIGDIRDLEGFRKAMQLARPEIVFHLAAQPLVRESYRNPVETYETNIMGTVHMFEAVRSTPSIKAVVNITTDKCYENREWVWGYREKDPMGGYDPYSSSKGCAELISAAYRSSFFNAKDYSRHRLAIATARAGNVIGGGDWAPDRLVPDILAAFERGEAVRIRNPGAVRPWQHVLEPLHGYLALAQRLVEDGPAFAEGWNFGPNDEEAQPVSWVVEQMARLWGPGSRWEADQADHPHEASFLKLDISKARCRLGWHPILRLGDALRLVVEWQVKRRHGADMRAESLQQIDSYQLSACMANRVQ